LPLSKDLFSLDIKSVQASKSLSLSLSLFPYSQILHVTTSRINENVPASSLPAVAPFKKKKPNESDTLKLVLFQKEK
jgi:hypothetical protein